MRCRRFLNLAPIGCTARATSRTINALRPRPTSSAVPTQAQTPQITKVRSAATTHDCAPSHRYHPGSVNHLERGFFMPTSMTQPVSHVAAGGCPNVPFCRSAAELRKFADRPRSDCQRSRLVSTVPNMEIVLRPLTPHEAEAHAAGEDDASVRWLSGGYAPVEGVREYFGWLAANEAAGSGKRGFGIWIDGCLGGYMDFDPDNTDGLEPGDVNIAYSVHPWARGRGVAGQAVLLLCRWLADHSIGERAAIRVEPENVASVRVAEKAGFVQIREFVSSTDKHPDGTPSTMLLFLRHLL